MSAPPNYTNATLMKAMGARKYDPMPVDQHQWQRAKGEPLIHRIWSVLCARSVHARLIGNRLVKTPYATEDDGVTPLTVVGLAKLLGEEDGGNVRQAWRRGEELGIWRRESGGLWLNGSVTEAQVKEAKETRTKVCTHLLTQADLQKIKGWPKERREEFHAMWNAVHDYERARIAEATGRERDECAPVKDNIKSHFGLEIRHIQSAGRKAASVPPCLSQFVQTAAYNPETGDVQAPASLLPIEKSKSATAASSKASGDPEEENRKKVAAETAAIPTPDMAAAEAQRRQMPEPSHTGREQSRDHTVVEAADLEECARKAAGFDQLSPDDRKFCRELGNIKPEIVRAGIVIARARRLVHEVNTGSASRVVSLRYFAGAIHEARVKGFDPTYVDHAEKKIARHGAGDKFKTVGGNT